MIVDMRKIMLIFDLFLKAGLFKLGLAHIFDRSLNNGHFNRLCEVFEVFDRIKAEEWVCYMHKY